MAIHAAQQEGVLHLTIHRPEKKNALTLAMYDALSEALEAATDEAAVRAVLLSGAEGCFTSGNDLADFMQHPPTDENSPVFRFLRVISTFPKPIVAAVQGPAIGIGTTMLLHCDLIFAAPSARFQMPFVSLGLCPEAASSLLLPRLVGHPRAAEWLLLGNPFDAHEAEEAHLINEVLSDDNVQAYALRQAETLAALPPASVRLTKALLKQHPKAAIEETMRAEAQHFAERLTSPEAAEAFTAFFEKRPPDFSRFT